MYPVNCLFHDFYRNDWNIASVANSCKRRDMAGPWVRDLGFLVKRKRG